MENVVRMFCVVVIHILRGLNSSTQIPFRIESKINWAPLGNTKAPVPRSYRENNCQFPDTVHSHSGSFGEKQTQKLSYLVSVTLTQIKASVTRYCGLGRTFTSVEKLYIMVFEQ